MTANSYFIIKLLHILRADAGFELTVMHSRPALMHWTIYAR